MKFTKSLDEIDTAEGETQEYGLMPVDYTDEAGKTHKHFYTGVIEEAEETTSKNGNEMVKLVIKLKNNPKYDGKMFWHYMMANTDWFEESVKKLLMAVNRYEPNLTEFDFGSLVGVGIKFAIKIKKRDDTGEEVEAFHFPVKIDTAEQDALGEPASTRPIEEVEEDSDIPW